MFTETVDNSCSISNGSDLEEPHGREKQISINEDKINVVVKSVKVYSLYNLNGCCMLCSNSRMLQQGTELCVFKIRRQRWSRHV